MYIPSEEIFTLPGEEAGKHPCGWNDNGERGSDVYAHYFNDHHAPRDFMNGLIYDQKISSKALMSTPWYQKYYEGNENRNVSYFNQIDGFAFSDGSGGSEYTEYKQDYRSIIKFGTHNSECYSGIIYFNCSATSSAKSFVSTSIPSPTLSLVKDIIFAFSLPI